MNLGTHRTKKGWDQIKFFCSAELIILRIKKPSKPNIR